MSFSSEISSKSEFHASIKLVNFLLVCRRFRRHSEQKSLIKQTARLIHNLMAFLSACRLPSMCKSHLFIDDEITNIQPNTEQLNTHKSKRPNEWVSLFLQMEIMSRER